MAGLNNQPDPVNQDLSHIVLWTLYTNCAN